MGSVNVGESGTSVVRESRPGTGVSLTAIRPSAGGESGKDPAKRALSPTPSYTPTPWACVTCGRWVPLVQRVYTDEGLFHDRIACLSGDRFEELVLKYGCRCVEQVSPHVVAVSL